MWILAIIPTDPSGRRKIDHREASEGTGADPRPDQQTSGRRAPDLCGGCGKASGICVGGETTQSTAPVFADRVPSYRTAAIASLWFVITEIKSIKSTS
jgi:hypothetical protein